MSQISIMYGYKNVRDWYSDVYTREPKYSLIEIERRRKIIIGARLNTDEYSGIKEDQLITPYEDLYISGKISKKEYFSLLEALSLEISEQ